MWESSISSNYTTKLVFYWLNIILRSNPKWLWVGLEFGILSSLKIIHDFTWNSMHGKLSTNHVSSYFFICLLLLMWSFVKNYFIYSYCEIALRPCWFDMTSYLMFRMTLMKGIFIHGSWCMQSVNIVLFFFIGCWFIWKFRNDVAFLTVVTLSDFILIHYTLFIVPP